MWITVMQGENKQFSKNTYLFVPAPQRAMARTDTSTSDSCSLCERMSKACAGPEAYSAGATSYSSWGNLANPWTKHEKIKLGIDTNTRQKIYATNSSYLGRYLIVGLYTVFSLPGKIWQIFNFPSRCVMLNIDRDWVELPRFGGQSPSRNSAKGRATERLC